MVWVADLSVFIGNLYKMGFDEILCRYVLEYERQIILTKANGGVAGGHYVGISTIHKIL